MLVRNPMNFHQVQRISLSPDVVDGIVFWTKNPLPMLERLKELKDYNYYFQFTLTSYATDIECNLPSKDKVLIPVFQKLSDMIGRNRVIWRYDPILLSEKYTLSYHLKYFELLCRRLSGYTEKCILSFLDHYRNTERNLDVLKPLALEYSDMLRISEGLSEIAHSYNLQLEACSEEIDLSGCGIGKARCVDARILEKLSGIPLAIKKDGNQRTFCLCSQSIDIGAYNTCRNGCLYCYANYNPSLVERNARLHDPLSPLLFGSLSSEDVITERRMENSRTASLF